MNPPREKRRRRKQRPPKKEHRTGMRPVEVIEPRIERELAAPPVRDVYNQRGIVEREQPSKSRSKTVVIFVVVLVVLGGTGAGVFLGMDPGGEDAVTPTLAPTTPFKPVRTTEAPKTKPSVEEPAFELDPEWTSLRGECGRPRQKPSLGRIVGGTEVVKHSWPWQIGLLQYKRYDASTASVKAICGGSLVGPKFVITAAHCFLNSKRNFVSTDKDGYKVLVGGHDKGRETNGARMIAIETVMHHPDNNLATFTRMRKMPIHDLTVLILRKVIDPNVVSPMTGFACLPQPRQKPPAGKKCWATGWGKTQGTGFDKQLKQVIQPVVSESACKKRYGKDAIFSAKHLCAGPNKGSQGTCQGDSGGPIVCQYEDGAWVLHGATSFGPQPCGTAPSVWAQVSHHMDWICCVLKDYGPCRKIGCKQ